MSEERQFKGIWIPKEIWLDDNLSALDKVILAEIDSLDDENNGCYASNQYIADFCKCSESKVSKTISTLKRQGYIYVQNFDGRKRYIKSNIKYCKADEQKMTGGIVKNAIPHSKKCYADEQKMLHINIENNIDNNIVENIKPVRHRYGEYKNVLLSDKEIEKLKAEIPNYQRYIENLSSYMMSTGKTYKSHLATIRNWARKDGVKPPKAETDEERIRREQNEQLLRVMGEI